MNNFADWVNQYGFPIVAAVGLGYFIYYIWVWATTKVKPVISAAMGDLIALVDRIRMLDNDMIRLNSKLSMVLEHQSKIDKKRREELEEIVARYQSKSESFNSTGK
jgi:hypothetical protein